MKKILITIFLLSFLVASLSVKAFESNNPFNGLVKTLANPKFISKIQYQKVSIIGENDYLPADDEDLNLPIHKDMDEGLKQIIKRTVRLITIDGNWSASSLLLGNNGICNRVITARHNTHYKSSKHPKVGKFRIPDKLFYVIHGKNKEGAVNYYQLNLKSLPEDYGGRWLTKDEGTVIDIMTKTVPGVKCPYIPIIPRNKIEKFNNCRIIGFPGQVKINDDGDKIATSFSAIPTLDKRRFYPYPKRGVAKCKILDNRNGLIVNSCDALDGASGGPLICKVNSKWSYVGTHNGSHCLTNGLSKNCNSAKKGNKLLYHSGKMDKLNRHFSLAGSFTSRNIPLQKTSKYLKQYFNSETEQQRKFLQMQLKDKGFYDQAPIDGLWGTNTRLAIELYAQRNNIINFLKTEQGSRYIIKKILKSI